MKMNNLKELEKLNNLSFKLLIFLPLINFIGSLALVKIEFGFDVIYIFNLVLILLQIFIFVRDRQFLKKNQAFCPAWEWFVLFPVYVYKRQRNNFLNLNYFYISLLFFILNAVINAYARTL
ncbi:hypothetical protein MWMV2_MWMV2_01296 [Acinetobacter oleivorans]|nr:hypothetical protein MWMV3_MWMV3_01296 [Acinetobacter oleivorans]CAI3126037.1 hypothetical protein MWMV5_MWMV5_01296 [Acinetobacter oleivorans]CAI3126059.1 hypothetical protein MWMV13_MWMV13_01296 [Acinetobacter oleivorans]CAI3126073.1 hypothetical protein MWMV12_MWMV12_01296 [Acinetobacter oleivorans]CAI3126194.1 hypothetical protein MWMV2_MWMV2_01296 [Acinetobacter oleivorans]